MQHFCSHETQEKQQKYSTVTFIQLTVVTRARYTPRGNPQPLGGEIAFQAGLLT